MASSELQLVISAKDDASKTLNSVSKSVSSFNNGVTKVGKAVGVAMLGATTAVAGFAVASFKAFSEAESGAIKLSKNLLTVKGNTLDHVEALKKQADAMQKYGVIEGDAIIAGQSQLATFGLQAKTIQTVTEKVADMATQIDGYNVTSETMVTLNNLVGKVLTGNVGALSRYGVTLSETQQKIIENGTESQRAAMLVKVLGQNFGDVNKALGDTPYGKWIQLKNAVGDAQETIGGVLSEAVAPLMEGLANFVKGDEFKTWVEDIGKKIKEWIDSIGGAEGIKNKLIDFKDFIQKDVLPILLDLASAVYGVTKFIIENKDAILIAVVAWETFKVAVSIATIIDTTALAVKGLTTATLGLNLAMGAGVVALAIIVGFIISKAIKAFFDLQTTIAGNRDIVDELTKKYVDNQSIQRDWANEANKVKFDEANKALGDHILEVKRLDDRYSGLMGVLNAVADQAKETWSWLTKASSKSDNKKFTEALQPFVKARAFGGAVTAGNPVVVGERRPEVFVPSQNGNIRQLDQVGAGKTVTVNFNNVSVRNDSDLSSIVEAVKQTLGREQELSRLGAY